jgi:hypothetical protein
MGRSKKNKLTLPLSLELINKKKGDVREFETEHALRILRLQEVVVGGNWTLFNEELYIYEKGQLKHRERTGESTGSGLDADWGNTEQPD